MSTSNLRYISIPVTGIYIKCIWYIQSLSIEMAHAYGVAYIVTKIELSASSMDWQDVYVWISTM